MGEESESENAVSEVAIMIRAHENWVAAGRPKGDGRHFWLEAERELRQEAEGWGKAITRVSGLCRKACDSNSRR